MRAGTAAEKRHESEAAGGGSPDSPLEINGKGWRQTIRRSLVEANKDRVPMMAGSIAYHWFLALFPSMIALVGLTQLLGISSSLLHTLIRGVDTAVPPGASGVIAGALKAAHGRTSGAVVATVIAVAVSIWSASSGMTVVESGLDVAYEVPQERKFVPKRLMAFVMMILMLVLGGVAAALAVFGGPLGSAFRGAVPIPGVLFSILWDVVRVVAVLVVVSLLLALVYYFAPNRKSPKWQWISIGSIAGAVIWLAASFALSTYVNASGSYGRTYGAFAGVALLLFWFYLTALAILLGGQINAEVERQAQMEGGSTGGTPPQDAPAA
ncbi:MAG: YihY/virulence factor BrkB family protein [Actinomycetota bacterium]|nr:YihY/virulence factor BrkB family protein [Actinomycetota bacterium]